MNRFYLAAQDDFGAKRGVYIHLENESSGDAPIQLATMKLILGVGDGANWQFPNVTPAWKLDHDYTVKAVVTPTGALLFLDGEKVAETPDRLVPVAAPLEANSRPAWASAPAPYFVIQKSLTVTVGPKTQTLTFPAISPALFLFEPQTPRRLAVKIPAAGVTLTAVFRLISPPAARSLAPLIDKYGQARAANWPGKVTADAQIPAAQLDENKRLTAIGAPNGFDKYGGRTNAGWTEKPTGFYRTVKRNGKWWLATPDGHPCFFTALDAAPAPTWEKTPVTGRETLFAQLPPKDGATASAWGTNAWGEAGHTEYAAFHSWNMARKWGADWQNKARESAARRLRTWGFSGLGKWCDPLPGVPRVPVLNRGDVPNVARHPDIFDPAVQEKFRETLRKQIEPDKTNPFVLGWSIGNEYDEIVTKAEVRDVLAKGETPLKRALLGVMRVAGDTDDAYLEKQRRFYADAYYDFLYKTVKAIDPNHLYLGFWIVPGWWENDEDWRLIARHCDIIGYDRYADNFADASLKKLIAETDKPIFCGEFGFPQFYDGKRGFGLYEAAHVDTEREAGAAYARWLTDAAANPFCVGVAWFQYRDQNPSGRGPGSGPNAVYGEHYAFGVVDVTDRPKWELATAMRAANLAVSSQRMKRK